MDNKIQRLEDLKGSLKFPHELGGEFVPEGCPKQFEFMFVAEMPSMSKPKNSTGVYRNYSAAAPGGKFLNEMMTKCGVAGSYITDIVKTINIPRRPTKMEIEQWLPFLLQEVEIVQPKAVIVFGKITYHRSFEPFVEPHIPKHLKVAWVWHYSQQGAKSNADVEQKFAEVINRIRKP
jgi:uracil-DNA glycosylase family 4